MLGVVYARDAWGVSLFCLDLAGIFDGSSVPSVAPPSLINCLLGAIRLGDCMPLLRTLEELLEVAELKSLLEGPGKLPQQACNLSDDLATRIEVAEKKMQLDMVEGDWTSQEWEVLKATLRSLHHDMKEELRKGGERIKHCHP